VWFADKNVAVDGGSYGYNVDPVLHAYFSGVESHNTVQFDLHDQMPRLGRFLFGAWPRLRCTEVRSNPKGFEASSEYADIYGNSHTRQVFLDRFNVKVVDHLDGRFSHAILRWRLCPGRWDRKTSNMFVSGEYAISIHSDSDITVNLTTGWCSTRYLERFNVPVIEVMLNCRGLVETKIEKLKRV
jgi:hypothetical protein